MPTKNQPITSIEGAQILLGPLQRDHLPLFWPWFNDLEVMCTYSPRWSPMTWERLEAWYQKAINDKWCFPFTVYDKHTSQVIGYTMLLNVNYHHQVADFDIIIGSKDHWGQGYGTAATKLTLDYGFTILGLHNIMLTVRSFNAAGIRAYQKAGFCEFGRRKEARRFGGDVYDLIYLDCIASEFESPVLSKMLPST